MKRIIAFLLLTVMLAASLASCVTNMREDPLAKPPVKESGTAESSGTVESGEQTTGEAGTTEEVTPAPESTRSPETTKAPETTKSPETTKTLETTSNPGETTSEGTSGSSSDVTNSPETTKTPDETTKSPETTKAPETECLHTSTKTTGQKNATCSAEGYTGDKVCSSCGKTLETGTKTEKLPHTEKLSGNKDATCSAEGYTGDKVCSVCSAVLVKGSVISKLSHTEETKGRIEPTCSSEGYTGDKVCTVCKATFGKGSAIPKSAHDLKAIGSSSVKLCSLCRAIDQGKRDALDISTLGSSYGYYAFESDPKGQALMTMYDRILASAVEFTFDYSKNPSDARVAVIPFSDLGLTFEELLSVIVVLKHDNPVLYWIPTSFNYEDSSYTLMCAEEYKSGAVRQAANKLIADKLAAIKLDETSAYNIALALHDIILKGMTYANNKDTGKPEEAIWAHNVLGFFEKGTGVCETYGRTFSLMLNYFGIENIPVAGVAEGEDHLWNMVKMDNGEWYWFDLTWDDSYAGGIGGGWKWGVDYHYFCIRDNDDINWQEGGWSGETKPFSATRTAFTNSTHGPKYLYKLPETAKKEFSAPGVLLVNKMFEAGDYTLLLAGYRAVDIMNVKGSGAVSIPQFISHKGIGYEVISIGSTNEPKTTGPYLFSYVINEGITSVELPKSLIFIWDHAFSCPTLESITVASDNPKFTSLDGVLFTKSLYTLIAYPTGSPRKTYAVPDATVNLAYGAFGLWDKPIALESFTLGKNVDGLSMASWGSPYLDKEPEGGFGGNSVGNGLFDIYRRLSGKKELIIHPENKMFHIRDNGVYAIYENINMLFLVLGENTEELYLGEDVYRISTVSSSGSVIDECLTIKNITVHPSNPYMFAKDGVLYDKRSKEIIAFAKSYDGTVTISDEISEIREWAFFKAKNIRAMHIGTNIRKIGSSVFRHCESLRDVYYAGSQSEWNAMISDPAERFYGVGEVTVHCSDGDIKYNY